MTDGCSDVSGSGECYEDHHLVFLNLEVHEKNDVYSYILLYIAISNAGSRNNLRII